MSSDAHYPFPEQVLDPNKQQAWKPTIEPILAVRVQQSPSIGRLIEALAKAQLKFGTIFKESENPAFRSKYADLATVIAATQKALATEGVVVIQSPTTKGKDLTLNTMLAHSSGEWLSSDLTMPATMREKFDAQSIGSAITYARRYALQAITGTSADIDDDGNAAADQGSTQAAQKVAKGKTAGASVPSLFYMAVPDQTDTYEVTGAQGLMESYRGILRKFWNIPAKAVIVNGEQLEGLKYTFEQASVPFVALKK